MWIECPIAIEWSIAESRIRNLENSVTNEFIDSAKFSAFNFEGIKYYLRMYPNGDIDERRGNCGTYLYLNMGNHKLVKTNYSISIESTKWSHKLDHDFKKEAGIGVSIGTIERVLNPANNFFVDGKLTIKMSGIFKVEIPHPSASLNLGNANYQKLWKSGFEDFLIDVKFPEEQGGIEVHRCVLATQSPVFAAMFKPSMKEGVEKRVEIADFSFSIVEKAIRLCYHNTLDSEPSLDELLILFKFVDKYDIESAKKMLEINFIGKISAKNICSFTNQVIDAGLPNLEQICMDFLVDCISAKKVISNLESLDKNFLAKVFGNTLCHESESL